MATQGFKFRLAFVPTPGAQHFGLGVGLAEAFQQASTNKAGGASDEDFFGKHDKCYE